MVECKIFNGIAILNSARMASLLRFQIRPDSLKIAKFISQKWIFMYISHAPISFTTWLITIQPFRTTIRCRPAVGFWFLVNVMHRGGTRKRGRGAPLRCGSGSVLVRMPCYFSIGLHENGPGRVDEEEWGHVLWHL